ncbi:glutamine-hydrolyzing carbamoyl-phosphate synthase small subunit [soil metagenome]
MRKLETTIQTNTHRNRSERGGFFVGKNAKLYLSDGTTFDGIAPDWQTGAFNGEVVFNTGMTGYIESLTDPSYSNQILVFTFPLIGNYGVDTRATESDKIQVAGVIVSEAAGGWSHTKSDRSLIEWLREQNIPILTDVDTRALTKHLRTRGTMLGSISDTPVKAGDITIDRQFVSIAKPVTYNPEGKKKVILVDCGAKENIVRSLVAQDLQVKRVPYNYDYTHEDYDGVMLSNGPGDPTDYTVTIDITRKALDLGRPVFGICLGTQIMALAAGAKTYKLKFGHRGHNQPCMQIKTNRGFITSQNHGYAIDAGSLPNDWRVSFTNLNDESVEGIEHVSKPFFSVQFHPEATPGPTDTAWLFKTFKDTL